MKKATYIALQIHAAAIALLLGPCSPAIAGGSVDNSALIPPYVPHDEVRLEGMSPDWVKSLVIVELRIETATEEGTFDAAISKLDHYAEMGVNALWICPVYDRKTESGYNNGYKNFGPHTVYPALTGVTSPDESYKVIRRFVEAAHQRNIRVFLDIISWGVAKDAPLVGEQPDFWIKLPSGEYREAYDGYLFDWSKPHFREWFVAQAVKLIEETKADGFRVDLAPDTSAYHFKEVRDALYSRGHKIAIFSEMPSEPRGTFDFAQIGVNGWTERPAYGQPEVFAEQKKRFGSLHDSSFMFRTNLVDAVKGGIGIGRPELQEKGEGGLFRFYAATPLCHDGYGPFVKGNLVRFGYIALSPFLPIWWIGEEWNNPKNVRKGTGVMYFNNIDWKAKSEPVNAEFFEEVKKVLRVRRMFPTIFEHFSESLREANIAKIDSTRDGTPNPLQAYMRYAGDKAVLVVPNYESTTPASTYRIKTFSEEWGKDQDDTVRLTDLMTGEVLATKPWAELREFEATIEAESLGVFLVEIDESASRADAQEHVTAHGTDAFPDRIDLVASGPAPVFREVAEIPLDQANFSVRFSARLEFQPAGNSEATRTAQNDLNFDAELACVVVRQLDAGGKELAADASLGVAKSGTHELSVEAAPVPGAVKVRLECRLSAIEGKAVFSNFRWEPEASRLFSSALARRLVAPGQSPAIEVNDRVVPPLMVHGQNLDTSDNADASVADLALPYRNGLRLFSFNAWFPGVTNQDTPGNLEKLVTAYPEAFFLLRVWLGPRKSFFRDYPEERLSMSDGEHQADIATPTSAVWRRYSEAAIRRFILSLRKSPAAERIAGIVPMYYVTGEWQLGDPNGPYLPKSQIWRMNGFSEQHRQSFADWAVARYENLPGVNTAWGTAYDSAAEIVVPNVEEREKGSWGSLRDPVKDQRTIDHGLFLSEIVSSAIVWSAEAFRRAFDERVLTGVFYGHVLEHAWSASGVQQQGHLGIARVLASPAIDFQGSPYSYANDSRPRGLPLTANAILESAALHGKAAFLEEDTYTHVANPPEGLIAPGAHQQTKSLEETLDVLNRNLGTSLARGYIHYWMGLLQDGRFNLPEIWDNYRPVFAWLQKSPLRPAYRPQVALVIDEQSIPYLAEGDRGIVGRWLYELRSILARVDTTMGVYLQSDLDRIPDSVRCLVLATPYRISAADEEILRRRWMRDGRSIVFCQFPDVFDDQPGRNDTPGRITGVRLEMLDTTAQPVSSVTGEGIFGAFAGERIGQPVDRAAIFWRPKAALEQIGPLVCIEDPDAISLARYDNVPGQPVSVAMKTMDDWTSVVTGVHSLTPAMWREVMRNANAHLYLDAPGEDCDRPDVIEATSDFVMVISGRDGERKLTLPEPGKLIPLDGGPASPELSRQHNLRLRAGVPRLFRIES